MVLMAEITNMSEFNSYQQQMTEVILFINDISKQRNVNVWKVITDRSAQSNDSRFITQRYIVC